ncbi:putative ALA-interacting subunit 2 [Hibiscus syriacus]|uniref:ALA-interacting subunit 2 n=1 Tax=Hibiscus syriacus TaxID=106335 RepID=A0A6A3AVY0_HIBSY|nr:putative ALA-interacting subunit 2 [Hibiscus syriacus]
MYDLSCAASSPPLQLLHHFPLFLLPPSLSFPRNLLSAAADGTISIFDTEPFVLLKSFRSHKKGINDLAVHPSGKLALSVSSDRCLAMSDEREKELLYARLLFELDNEKRVLSAAPGEWNFIYRCEDDPYLVASASSNGLIRVWDVRMALLLDLLVFNDSVSLFFKRPKFGKSAPKEEDTAEEAAERIAVVERHLEGSEMSETNSDRRRRGDRESAFYLFTQQRLPACKPVLTPPWVITIYFLISFIFVPVGLFTLRASHSVVEIEERYDIECVPTQFSIDKVSYIQNGSIPKNCSLLFKVDKYMKAPIYIYYQLDNYYQNHRRTNIAWKSDQDHKFGKNVYPFNFQNGTWIGGGKLNPRIPLSDQEDLIVWMRISALPSFRKLYGRIEEDLDAGDYVVVHLMNNYNTYSFGGKKKLVLSTSNWLGGKNDFLGLAYVFVGSSSLTVAIVFMLLHLRSQR